MKVLEVAKPIIKKRTGLGQAYDDLLKDLLPIHAWCEKNKKK
jgi:hypothetical protein